MRDKGPFDKSYRLGVALAWKHIFHDFTRLDIIMRGRKDQDMRTTLNIQDEALRLGKRVSRERGKSLGEVVSEALVAAYGQRPAGGRKKPFDPPVSGRGGLQHGVNLDDSSALADLMESG